MAKMKTGRVVAAVVAPGRDLVSTRWHGAFRNQTQVQRVLPIGTHLRVVGPDGRISRWVVVGYTPVRGPRGAQRYTAIVEGSWPRLGRAVPLTGLLGFLRRQTRAGNFYRLSLEAFRGRRR